MPQWITDLFGASLAPIVWVAFVAAMVCILAMVVILFAKRALSGGVGIGPRGRAPRLQVVDVARVDEKRRLVLLRRDDVEHLVLVGGQTDIVVEAAIMRHAAASRPARPEDGRLDIPAAATGAGRRPVPSEDPGRLDHPALAAVDPAPSRRQASEEGWPGKTDTSHPAPADRREPAPQPRVEPASATTRTAPRAAAPSSAAQSALPTREDTADRRRPAAPAASPREPRALAVEIPDDIAAVETRAPVSAPAVAAPLRASDPPLLNPSTMAYSRATPTLPSRQDPALSDLATQSRPAAAEERIEPRLDTPMPAVSDDAPPRAEANGQSAPAADRAGVFAETRERPQETRAAATVSPQPAGAERESVAAEARPLSVRSFASAIQARRSTRSEGSAATARSSASPSGPASPAAETSQGAAGSRAAAPGVDRSIEEFLSAELTAGLQDDFTREEPGAEAPPTAAAPAAARVAPVPPRTAQAERQPTAPQPKPLPAQAGAASGTGSKVAGAGQAAQAAPSAPSKQAPASQERGAAAPGVSARPTAAPQSSKPAPAEKSGGAGQAGQAGQTAAPVPRVETARPAANAPLEAEAASQVRRPVRPSQEIDLEEEMKRLLGELDLESPAKQTKKA
ncbi:flagellar biosynthetic protein FliO [Jiella sonneratiae]|uniref:Flagellar biosynthetic protein FliO n=1 Tax=Jiella sonneratiae TaxID=2816856 RepID=A0ABS3J7K1_9HYPH|nr:flagellar biosynthetic protein FliO [Jiella sonneratiae]MBO0905642.1 flagellar biosynthetic protein FliO [Jiella sonneratiae]